MNNLSAHISLSNQIIECHQGQRFEAEVLTIEQGDALSLSTYIIDNNNDPSVAWIGKRPEGLLISQLSNGDWWVIFIEMKRTNNPDACISAVEKFQASIEHFCNNVPGSHGNEHHTQWMNRSDIIPNIPNRDHKIGAVMVVTRSGARTPNPIRVVPITPTTKKIKTRIFVRSYDSLTYPVCGKAAIGLTVNVDEIILK